MSKDVCIMLDVESLGDTPDSVMVSIAAHKFTIEDGPIDVPFEINIDPASCKALGFKVYQSTVDWWMTQPKEARDAWRKNPVPISTAIERLTEWVGKDSSKAKFYCKGMNFDFPMITLYCRALGVKEPWKYWNLNDARTIYNLFGLDTRENRIGTSHVAMDDVLTQIKHLRKILAVEEDIPF